jgi:hypothetical protein
MPARLLNTLWSVVMPRWAAFVWSEDKKWPAPGTKLTNTNIPFGSLKAPAGEPQFEATLDAQVDELKKYLKKKASAPVRFAGVGGFDFVISDKGIDLFAPPHPAEGKSIEDAEGKLLWQARLVYFYTFRPTGRRAVGLPQYLTGDKKYSLVGAPFLAATGASQVLYEPPKAKWKVSGAVLRGILEQLPRLTAEVWQEDVVELTRLRDQAAKTDDTGLRQLFRERLETDLPSGMEFETFSKAPPQKAFATAIKAQGRNLWKNDDSGVVITSKGFYIPEIPALPDAKDMLRDIARGRAGNPVFTDSGMTG